MGIYSCVWILVHHLGPLEFSVWATIDHHGPYIHSGHYTASINCCKKTFYCNDNTITEFGIIDSKNSSTAYVILYELIDIWGLDSNRRVGVWSLPWRWHILSISLTTCRGTVRFLRWMPLFIFLCSPIVSCSLIYSLTLGCSWLLVSVLNNTLILGV